MEEIWTRAIPKGKSRLGVGAQRRSIYIPPILSAQARQTAARPKQIGRNYRHHHEQRLPSAQQQLKVIRAAAIQQRLQCCRNISTTRVGKHLRAVARNRVPMMLSAATVTFVLAMNHDNFLSQNPDFAPLKLIGSATSTLWQMAAYLSLVAMLYFVVKLFFFTNSRSPERATPLSSTKLHQRTCFRFSACFPAPRLAICWPHLCCLHQTRPFTKTSCENV
ncbi:MAG: hypothetical protein Q4G36_09630 [Paracoccus sp. (in: a-proteobacteria)]|nr:hypothetical protein [Paracoccus sp. (in: a-proteobacteria)]